MARRSRTDSDLSPTDPPLRRSASVDARDGYFFAKEWQLDVEQELELEEAKPMSETSTEVPTTVPATPEASPRHYPAPAPEMGAFVPLEGWGDCYDGLMWLPSTVGGFCIEDYDEFCGGAVEDYYRQQADYCHSYVEEDCQSLTAAPGTWLVGNKASADRSPAGTCEDNEESSSPMIAHDARTTVMLRNLPNNYTRAMLVALLDAEGFQGRYDFVYLPIDFKTHAGLGYAFVNALSPADAHELWLRLEGFSKWALPSEKVCTVGWSSPHQGLVSHLERYQNSPVMHDSVPDEWKPMLLVHGQHVPFPSPTKKIKAPRINLPS